jgi:glycosyltransferase involved in cell wall biosynthesis
MSSNNSVTLQQAGVRIAVVLPAYNEELTIADTMRAFARHLPEASIYVINNNSKDKTAELAASTLRELGRSGAVIDEKRQGKGNALRRAFHAIDADVYVLADADLTYPAERARDLMAPILRNEADMVVGDRHSGGHYAKENTRSLHGFGNRLVQNTVNLLFNAKLVDIMSGYRAFSREFVKNYPILVEGFQIETDMTLHALDKRFRIFEISIEYKDRPEGSFSKLNTLSDGAKVLFTIAQILRYYRPLLFFGGLSVVFALAGLLAGVPVINDWIQFKFIHHVPLAILAAGLEIFAVVLLAIGLTLDSLSHTQRMQFERALLSAR